MSGTERPFVLKEDATAALIDDFIERVTSDPAFAQEVAEQLATAANSGKWPKSLAGLLAGPGEELPSKFRVTMAGLEVDPAVVTTALTAALTDPGWRLTRAAAEIQHCITSTVRCDPTKTRLTGTCPPP
jgi:hypothetical protein